MKSPTSTILNSIQVLKSKLRNDHLELQGIRRDFAMGPTKPILQLEERSQSPAATNFRVNSSIEKNARAKLIQIRKHHQMEIKSILEKHKKDKEQLIHDYQHRIEQITSMFEDKINEQASYIQILEEQTQEAHLDHVNLSQPNKNNTNLQFCPGVCSVICAEMTFDNKINFQLFASSREPQNHLLNEIKCNQQTTKYEKIVNKLLHQNAALLESVETLKMENRRLLYHSTVRENSEHDRKSLNSKKENTNKNQLIQSRSSQYLSLVPVSVQQSISDSCYRAGGQANKNRLKFSKGCDRMKTYTDRSYGSIGNENIDTSNIMYRNANSIEKPPQQKEFSNSIIEEDEDSILSEEMKLRTIKHFMKVNSHRSTEVEDHAQSYVVPKMPIKNGVGIRNALKKISL